MPELFKDRLVQYPKRFIIQADGNDGTDNDAALDGKTVAFTVQPGVVTEAGTPLNAEELNKRIVADFEEKTFTQITTVLNTINIDKDENGNINLKRLNFRSLYQLLDNPGKPFVTTSPWTPIGATEVVNINGNIENTGDGTRDDPIMRQVENVISGRTYFSECYVRVKNPDCQRIVIRITGAGIADIVNPVQNVWYKISGQRTSSFTGAAFPLEIRHEYVDAATANGKTMEVLYGISYDVTDTHLIGLTTDQMSRQIGGIVVEGKSNTKNPKLKTIGKNLFDKKQFVDDNPSDYQLDDNDVVQVIGIDSRGVGDTFGYVIPVEKGKTYKYKVDTSFGLRVYDVDNDGLYLSEIASATNTEITFVPNFNHIAVKLVETVTFPKEAANIEIYEDTSTEEYREYNSNEDDLFGFNIEGESISFNGLTKADKIVKRNNKYYFQKQIAVEAANFQANGGIAGNWSNTFGNNMDADFLADLGFDVEPELDADGLGYNPFARIIIDGQVYLPQNTFTPTNLYFAVGTSSLPKDLRIRNDLYTTPAAWAAHIAAASEIIFDILLPIDDFEESLIPSTGYTVVEENGTVILVNENGPAFEVETEVPTNHPQSILDNTKEIRRLHNIKMEMVMLEDYGDDPLIIPRASVGGNVDLTDNFDYEVYCLALYNFSTPAKVDLLFFYKIELTSLGIQYTYARYYSGPGEVVPQISIATDNSNKKFTASNSILYVNDIPDTTVDTYVLAVYGGKAFRGDPR